MHLLFPAIAIALLAAGLAHKARAAGWRVPPAFVEQALCVHAGRHYTARWYPGARPQYALFGHVFYLTHPGYDDIPHGPAGADGEGPWSGVVGGLYGGGLSFMVGTWNHAGGAARSTYDIARASVAEQIYRAFVVVTRDGNWREWPQTSHACGY